MLKIKGEKKFDTAEEIRVELLDQLQKYPTKAKEVYNNATLTTEEKLQGISRIMNMFCGLSNFMNNVLGLEVRTEEGQLFTQYLFNKMHYMETMLKVEQASKAEQA